MSTPSTTYVMTSMRNARLDNLQATQHGSVFPVVCLTRLNPWWNCPKECAFKSFRELHISSLTVLHPDSIAKLLLLEIPTWAHAMHWQRAPQTCLAFLNISYGTTCYIAFPCISCCLMLSWCCLSITWMAMYGNAWRVFGDAAIWRNISRSRINCSTCMRSICLKDAWSTGASECLGLYMPLSSLYDRFTIGLLQVARLNRIDPWFSGPWTTPAAVPPVLRQHGWNFALHGRR